MKKELSIVESARMIMEAEEINYASAAYNFMKKKNDKFTDAGWEEVVDAKKGIAIPLSKWTETEKLVKQMFATKKEGEEIDEGENSKYYNKYGKMVVKQIDMVIDFVKNRGGNVPYDYDDLPDSLKDKLEQIKNTETLWSDTERLLNDIRAAKHLNKKELDENIVDLIDADGKIMVHGKLDTDDGENYVIGGKKYPKKGLRLKVWEGKEEKEEIDEEAGKQLDWGFDLTEIPAEKWSELVRMFDLKLTHINKGGLNPFSWQGKGLEITTANNPITGEYHDKKLRANEKGYASYIGLTGDGDKVKQAKNFIKKNAVNIKDESPNSRDFI